MTEIRSATQRQRDKIRSGKIVERLIAHVHGEIEMTNSQVNAAKALMSKVLPDVRTTELKGSVQVNQTHRLTDEQLMAIAAQGLNTIEGQCETIQEPLTLVGDK